MKSWRNTLHEVIFEADTPSGKSFDIVLLWLIVLSVLTVLLESVPEFQEQYHVQFAIAEWIFTGLFTIEYLHAASFGCQVKSDGELAFTYCKLVSLQTNCPFGGRTFLCIQLPLILICSHAHLI